LSKPWTTREGGRSTCRRAGEVALSVVEHELALDHEERVGVLSMDVELRTRFAGRRRTP